MSNQFLFLERYRGIIPDFEGFLAAVSQPPPVFVRANTLRIGLGDFRRLMAERGYALHSVPGIEEAFRLEGLETPGSTLEYLLGYYHVQGLISMLPARILDPRPEETVLDLCAAPGGKATHLAQLMQNRGLVVANDIRRQRLNILRSHTERLGSASIVASRYDGQNFPRRLKFDHILLDPPCSAEGTYRSGRRPASEHPEAIQRLSRIQRGLLHRALEILRPGGSLVYSTCTYAPEENEEVIHEALSGGRAELRPISAPFPHSSGLTSFREKIFHPDLVKSARFYPHQVNSWGFFIAHLHKPG